MRTVARTAILVCGLALGSSAAVLGDVHLWTFDESEGIFVSDVTGDRPGERHGAAWTDGRIASGLRFDGVDDYVALPDNDPVWLPFGDFTICFWVCFERGTGASTADNEVLADFNAGSSSNPENELGYIVFRHGQNGTIAFQMATMQDPDEDLESQLVPVKGQWYHIAAVRRGTLQMIYVDGRLDAWRTCSSSPIDFVGGYDDDKVNVGRYTTTVGSPRYHFKGTMDELMLSDRALSAEDVRQLREEGLTSHVLHVDAALGDDRNDGLRSLTALATVQKALNAAGQGAVIDVHPGVYREAIHFPGKTITLQSAGDAAILEAPDGIAVSFASREGAHSVLRNLIIRNSQVGIWLADSSPTISNVTVVGNVLGVEAYGCSEPGIANSIFWGNAESDLYGCVATYSCVERGAPGVGNFSLDPLFVDSENGDYHLRSKRGRYWPEHDIWVLDKVNSPCLDAGDPAWDFSAEPEPNGGRLNVGAHGGTAYAEMSEGLLSDQ